MLRRVFFYPSRSRGLSFSPVLLDWRRTGHDDFDERTGPRQSQRRRRGTLPDEDGSARVQDDNKNLQFYGFNNFQRLLQNQVTRRHHQDDETKPKPKKSSTPRRSRNAAGVTPEPTPNYDKFKRIAADDQPTPEKEVSVGDVKETDSASALQAMLNRRQKKGVSASVVKETTNATTSSWVLVENTPNSANVSDLYESLNEILEFEVGKGIIDLDGIQNNDKARAALEDIGALESLYTTQAIDNDDIPLWTPDEGDSAGGAR
ncbi:hypothetical protein THAOC_24997, partial [Thalassiosira oceanica]